MFVLCWFMFAQAALARTTQHEVLREFKTKLHGDPKAQLLLSEFDRSLVGDATVAATLLSRKHFDTLVKYLDDRDSDLVDDLIEFGESLGLLGDEDDEEDHKVLPDEFLCPENCDCAVDTEPGCHVYAVCSGLTSFPRTPFPIIVNCVELTDNDFSHLSTEEKIEGLANLSPDTRMLHLDNCRLGTLPSLGHLKELRFLNLEGNRLTQLDVNVFSGLSHLKILYLTGPHVEEDEPGYDAAVNAGNRIERLHEDLFEGLLSLQILLLHHNRLSSLPPSIFNGTPNLKVLKLLDNNFDPPLLPQDAVFQPLISMEQLDLEEDSGDDLEDEWLDQGLTLADVV
eukprot:m.77901 g.77901  ORF g.77901 m.77901 type:complete len:340 (+) comp20709_c0_seq2:47-1066(+)